MYSLILASAGALLLVYALYTCRKLIPLIRWPYMRIPWRLSVYIIFLFLVGYVFYVRVLLLPSEHQLDEFWVSGILFSGAIIITILIDASYQLIDWLATSETVFAPPRSVPEYDQRALDKERKLVEMKMGEVMKALEEVYNLRERIEKGKLSDLHKINKRLGKIEKVISDDKKEEEK